MIKILKNLHIISGSEVLCGSVGVEDGRISFVGEIPKEAESLIAENPCGVEIYDYQFRFLVFPGLFNAHTHLSMVLFRNYADGLPLMEWLETKIWPIEARLTPEDVYYSSLLGMAELIRSGCTAFRDMYDFMDRVADATILSGLRGMIGQGMIIPNEDSLYKLDIPRRLHEKYICSKSNLSVGTGRIKIEVAPHAPYTCTDSALVFAKKLADELSAVLHIHLSESDDEMKGSFERYGMSPTERLYNLGVLGKTTAAAHCVKMSDDDLEILAKTGTSVLLNPSSNLKLGNGIARAKDMSALGINLSIGTDGASSNNNLDMMEEMHLTSLIYGLSPAEVLTAATVGGAKSAGFDNLGLIKKGYLADLAFLDLSAHNLTPHGDLIAALCYSANSSNISDLMVGGEFVMKDRKILTFDEEKVKSKCREIASELVHERNDFGAGN